MRLKSDFWMPLGVFRHQSRVFLRFFCNFLVLAEGGRTNASLVGLMLEPEVLEGRPAHLGGVRRIFGSGKIGNKSRKSIILATAGWLHR